MLNGISHWLASYLSCPVVMPYPYHTQIACSAMPSLYALPLTYPVFMPFPSYAQSLCPTTDIPRSHALPCPVSMSFRWHTLSSCPSPHMPSLYALPLIYPVFMTFPSYAQSLRPTTDIPCLNGFPSYAQSPYPTAVIPCRDVLPLSCPVVKPYHLFANLPCPILAQTYAYLVHAHYTIPHLNACRLLIQHLFLIHFGIDFFYIN